MDRNEFSFSNGFNSETDLISASLEGRASRRTLLRHGLRAGMSLTAVAALVLMRGSDASAKKPSPIPPNCIFVCCDQACDKLCYRCVKWPKPKVSQAVELT